MSRLKREGNPPSGQLASPVPQAWDPSINDFREITGQSLGDGRFGADGLQWGKTAGGLFVPIRVDNEGRQEVTLSGTNVPQETTILARAIRRANSGIVQINPPEGLHVRGVAIVCRIYGVTGTFEETQGLSMETGTFAGAYPAYGGEFMATSDQKVKTTGGVAHIWLPGGTTVGDSKPISNYVYRRSGSPFVRGYLALYINGTFTSEQGFDCEVKAIWQV